MYDYYYDFLLTIHMLCCLSFALRYVATKGFSIKTSSSYIFLVTFSGKSITVSCPDGSIAVKTEEKGATPTASSSQENPLTEDYNDQNADKYSCQVDGKDSLKFYIKAKGRAYILEFLS